jgi:hypothetical protein
MNFSIKDTIISGEIRNGVGIDLEFVDSRPVWTMNRETGDIDTMCMEGVIILLPFINISIGKVYKEVEYE